VATCAKSCDSNADCKSFSLCLKGPHGCYLKDKVITANDPRESKNATNVKERGCRTYYKETGKKGKQGKQGGETKKKRGKAPQGKEETPDNSRAAPVSLTSIVALGFVLALGSMDELHF